MITLGGAALLLALQVQATGDSAYATGALRTLVREVATENARVPAGLGGFTGRVQTEVALLRLDAAGIERVMSVQQVALAVDWNRDGHYREHAVGMRSESRTLVPYDALSLRSFTVPVLFGNRMDLLFGPYGTDTGSSGARRGAPLDELHPLAANRDRLYRFEGGEATQRWRVGGRNVTVVRIGVTVARPPAQRTTVFEGDLFVDLERHQLVALRGVIGEVGGQAGVARKALRNTVRAAGTIELVMAESQGKYWLPGTQRMEMRLSSALAEREMIVVRLSSRFSDVGVRPSEGDTAQAVAGDAPTAFPRRLSVARADSLQRFSAWRTRLGSLTGATLFEHLGVEPELSVHVEGGPRIGTRTLRESIRMNRVEGLFTGLGVLVPFGTGASRGLLEASGGRAWSEEVWRGQLGASVSRASILYGARMGRDLESTNDFLLPADNAAALLGPLLTKDDHDYLDRRSAGVFVERAAGSAVSVRLEVARVADSEVERTLSQGLIRRDSAFRENRPITPGTYSRVRLTLTANPDVLAEYLLPGIGLSAGLESATGDLSYSRFGARVAVQSVIRDVLTVGAQLDAGAMVIPGRVPLQQLLEIGGPMQLPGFDYKTSAGDRAALAQLTASLSLSFIGPVRRLPRSLRPRLAASLHTGVAEASSERIAAAASVLQMESPPCEDDDSCRAYTERHAGVKLGVYLLDGALFLGSARRISEEDRWKFAFKVRIF